jgi:hypothetical protein
MSDEEGCIIVVPEGEENDSAAVPDDDFARLMYYLSCIERISTIDFARISKYTEYSTLSSRACETMLNTAVEFSPDILYELGVFVPVGDDAIKNENGFFDINQQSYTVVASSNISIGKFNGEITKIMLYKQNWLEKYYLSPLRNIIAALKDIKRPPPPKADIEADIEADVYVVELLEVEPKYENKKTCCKTFSDCICCRCIDCCDCAYFNVCRGCDEDDDCTGTAVLFILAILFPPIGLLIFICGFFEAKSKLKCAGFYGTFIGISPYITWIILAIIYGDL